MSAKVWKDSRGTYQLVDRAPGQKRKMEALGKTEADRLRGEELAAAINAERAARVARTSELRADAPIMGATAIRAWWDQAQSGFGDEMLRNADWLIQDHLLPYWARIDLRRFTREQVKSFGGEMARKTGRNGKPLGWYSVRNAASILRRVTHWLDEQPHLEYRIPVKRIVALATEAAGARGAHKGRREAWTRKDAEAMLQLALSKPALHRVMFAALHTGARKGELLALRWSQVDLENRLIVVASSRLRSDAEKGTKTLKIRKVEMSPDLHAMLWAMRTQRAFTDAEHVFLATNGKPWKYESFDTAWKRLQKRAHLQSAVRDLPFHSWRHTFVSWALQAGEDPAWIAKQIGDRIETMLAHYSHFVPGRKSTHGFLSGVQGTAAQSPHPAPPVASAREQ